MPLESRPPASIAPNLVHEEGGFRIGTFASALIIRFEGAPKPDQLNRVYLAQQELVKATGSKVAMVSVIFPAGLSFDEEARKKSSKLLEKMRDDILVGTQIVTKQGFFASIIRSVMMGVQAMAKPEYPTKICGSIRDGADFVAEQLAAHDLPVGPDELADAIRQVAEYEG